jgi:hypothetical protein
MVVEAATTTRMGLFAPANVGAMWIESESGEFVKTLAAWGRWKLQEVVAWHGVSGWNVVDAITGATRLTHGPIQATWNCTDAQRKPVPYGRYRVCMSFTEQDAVALDASIDHGYCVPFDFGPTPIDVTPPPADHFNDIRIVIH